MNSTAKRRPLFLLVALVLGAGFISAPVQFGSAGVTLDSAVAAHVDTDGQANNGHGNNRDAEGDKYDDQSNPSYDGLDAADPNSENDLDGNSGRGDDAKGGKKDGK